MTLFDIVKKSGVTCLSLPLQCGGYSRFAARALVRLKKRGGAERFLRSSSTFASIESSSCEGALTFRSYLFLHPFSSLRNTEARSRSCFYCSFSDFAPETLCELSLRRGELCVTRHIPFPESSSADVLGIFECIRKHGSVLLLPCKWGRKHWVHVSFVDGQLFCDGRLLGDSTEGFASFLFGLLSDRDYLMTKLPVEWRSGDSFSPSAQRQVLRLYCGGLSGDRVRLLDACLVDGYGLGGNFDQLENVSFLLDSDEEIHMQVDIESGLVLGGRRASSCFSDEKEGDYSVGERIAGFEQIVHSVEEVLSETGAGLPFVSVDVALPFRNVLEILDISKNPSFPIDFSWSEDARLHLKMLLKAKEGGFSFWGDAAPNLPILGSCRRFFVGVKRFLRKNYRRMKELLLRSQGFSSVEAHSWVVKTSREIRLCPPFLRKKAKCLASKGFIPTHGAFIEGHGCEGFWRIAEKSYASLHPLNGKYGIWVNDRISALRVFSPYREHFENTYAQIYVRDGQLLVVGSSLWPEGKEQNLTGLAEFLSERRSLDVVSSSWRKNLRLSLQCAERGFCLNGRLLSYDQLSQRLIKIAKKVSLVVIDPVGGSCVLDGVSGEEPAFVDVILRKGADGNAIVCEARVCWDSRKDASPTRGEALGIAANGCSGVFFEDDYFARPLLGRYERRVSVLDVGDGSLAVPDEISCFLGAEASSCKAHLPGWGAMKGTLESICSFAPHLNFVEFRIRPTKESFKIVGIDSRPSYWIATPYSQETQDYLLGLFERKKEACSSLSYRIARFYDGVKRAMRKRFTLALYPKGLVYYQGTRWLFDVLRDYAAPNGVSLRAKRWAHKNGFLSWRIPQYGITTTNRDEFISDFEYRWLRHINGKYRYWLEDKVTIKYVLSEFADFLPEYYFFTEEIGGRNVVIRMMDCPLECTSDVSGVLLLAKMKGTLAMKPDEGSHGEGFCKLEYVDGLYYLNGVESSERDVRTLLEDTRNQYVITEYIVQHAEIARLYPGSVNTLRLTVFKRDGVHAEVGNAYLRIGTSKTGGVDNIGAGGMMAEVDVATGRFGNASVLQNGGVVSQATHPDTGILIEGVVPNWEFAKSKVVEMANELSQLEYFGFDIAITETGIKLPEVNRFPDFPRIDKLTPETMTYLLERLEAKKKDLGYGVDMPRRFFGLPERND